MAKKANHGGARSNAGAPKTGVNTVNIGFSVHKDFAPVIKAMVQAKVKELKELQRQANETGEPITLVLTPAATLVPVKPVDKVKSAPKVSDETKPDPKKQSEKGFKQSANNFLESRRASKLK